MHTAILIAIAVLALTLPAPTTATATVDWSVFGIGPGDDVAHATTIDNNGNVYVFGSFHGHMELTGHTVLTTLYSPLDSVLTSPGVGELFGVALDSRGGLVWSLQSNVVAGSGPGFRVADADAWTVNDNYVFVAATLEGSAELGGVTFAAPAGAVISVVLQFDASSGHLLWSSTWDYDGAYGGTPALAFDPTVNILAVTSYVVGNATVSPGTPPSLGGGAGGAGTRVSCPLAEGERCAVVAAYAVDGGLLWTSVGTPTASGSWMSPSGIVFSTSENKFFVVGSMNGCAHFTGAEATAVCVPGKGPGFGHQGVFIADFATDGTFGSGVAFNTGIASETSSGTSVDVDASGNAYVVGTFRHSATFGKFNLVGTSGTWSIFALQYLVQQGEVGWAEVIASDGADVGAGVHVTPDSDDVLVVGIIAGSIEIQGVAVNVSDGVVFAQFHASTGELEYAQVQTGELLGTDFAIGRTESNPSVQAVPMALVGGFLSNTTDDVFNVAIILYSDDPSPPAPPSPPTTTAVTTASSSGLAPAHNHKKHAGIVVAIFFFSCLAVAGVVFGYIYYRSRSGSFPHERLRDPSARSANLDDSLTAPVRGGSYGAL